MLGPVPEIDVPVMEYMEMLEGMDLLEYMDMLEYIDVVVAA